MNDPLRQEIEVGEVHHNELLEKSFNTWSAVGLMAAAQATPIALGGYLSLVIGVGGPPVFVYSYFIGCTFSMIICLSLAEIASVYPSAAGQIYWTAVLSSNRHSRWLSYLTGWMLCIGWFLWIGGTNLLGAQILFAIVGIFYPDFAATTWQVYLMLVALTGINFLLNVPWFRIYPQFSTVMLFWFNLGAVFIFASLLTRAHPKQSAHDVFVAFVNATGWESSFVVFCIGLVPGVGFVTGFDCATHLADEVPNPKRVVPMVMVGSSAISFIAGLPMLFTYMFCITKPDNLLTPIGRVPLIQLFVDGYDSTALTMVSSLIIMVGEVAAATAVLCTASRSWWAFAQQKGTPFPEFFSRVNSHWSLPVNSITFLSLLTVAVSAICMGSNTALNAILGGGLLCIYITYLIPMLLMLKGRSKLPKGRQFNLGPLGPALNVLGIGWMIWMLVWMCFPLYLPVTAQSMNYTSVILVAVVVISAITWFGYSKDKFVVPTVHVHEGIVIEDNNGRKDDGLVLVNSVAKGAET